MIIEDNQELKKELIDFLSRYRYDAYGPEEFQNVVGYILGEEPDLILLDINLPYYDGYYICREIRKRKNTTILMELLWKSDLYVDDNTL